MDEMKIKGSFLRTIVSRMISKQIKKKYGVQLDVVVENLEIVRQEDGRYTLNLNIQATGLADALISRICGVKYWDKINK